MLDVLIPVTDAFAAGAELAELRNVAELSAKATTPMRATRGRASFLGERSIGHMDPGARSAWLMIAAACDAWEKA
jgi:dihydroxyacetone kinase-like protein